jgi:transcriptional regulator of acetoin/glycerol metabolism
VVNVCNERVLTIDHLPPEILTKRRSAPLEIPVKEYEKSLIVSLLKRHNGNITRVANEMGIARTTLYKKIAKYHLHQ